MQTLISGTNTANKTLTNLRDKVKAFTHPPFLRIVLVGTDPASQKYVKIKKTRAEEIGIKCEIIKLPENTDIETIKTALQKKCDGIILQLPLPAHLHAKTDEILEEIPETHDIDCLKHNNFEPPIVFAIKNLLQDWNENWETKKFIIWGRGRTGGLPIATFLKKLRVNYEIIDENTPRNLAEQKSKYADIVIGATGIKNIIDEKCIHEDTFLIPINPTDFTDSVYEKSFQKVTKFDGIGPLVVAGLLQNVIAAHETPKNTENS